MKVEPISKLEASERHLWQKLKHGTIIISEGGEHWLIVRSNSAKPENDVIFKIEDDYSSIGSTTRDGFLYGRIAPKGYEIKVTV